MNNTPSLVKNLSFYAFCLFFLINLFTYPNEIAHATKTGILLWYNNILPSIFSFMILANVLSYSNFMQMHNKYLDKICNIIFKLPLSSFLAMILGMLSGYPIGAKITSILLANKSISLDEANRTICFANCCGPMFIIGAIGLNMFNNIKYGYILLASQILTAFTIAFFMRFYKKSSISKTCNTTLPTNNKNFSTIINSSIINSIDTILNICGIITFFCVIIKICELYEVEKFIYIFLSHIFSEVNYEMIKGIVYGMIEITNGIYLISISSNLNDLAKILLTSFLINFNGICILMQTQNVTTGTNINLKMYTIVKFISGLISLIYTYVLFKL